MSNQRLNYSYSYNKRRNVAKNCKVTMYDWIHITSNYELQGYTLEQVMGNAMVTGEYKNYITHTKWLNGKVTNVSSGRALHISANDRGILTIKVCPPKFIHGNNVQEATLEETLNLFSMLSNMVGYDLGDTSLVKSIDVTHTALTDFKPVSYFPYLCNQQGENRWTLNSTLYYGDKNSKTKQKKFYDKERDVKKNGGKQYIPEEFKGQNMTRFEVGLGTNAQISKIIGGGDTPVLGNLFTMESVEKLHHYWQEEYNAIPKLTELDTNFTKGMRQKGVQDEIINAALSAYGRLNIEEAINHAADMGALSYSAKSRALRKMMKHFEDGATKHDLIMELDKKILGFEPKWE